NGTKVTVTVQQVSQTATTTTVNIKMEITATDGSDYDYIELLGVVYTGSTPGSYIGVDSPHISSRLYSYYAVGQNLPQTCQGYHHSRDLDRYTTGEDFDETGAHPLLSCVNGVYPFGPLFDASSVEVSPVYDNRGHADFYGAITKYKGGFAPVGALVENDFAETSCTAENWVLNGVGLPFPEDRKFLPSVTSSTKVSQNFGATLDTQGIARTHGDTTKVTLMMDKVKAFELLKMLKDT
ncbi:MAG: hypothetical protein GY781_14515, partial [Gammaproteobacteria bacterium]|nr:hypothetical protein [Gammaproteobacteria bacterium]